MKIENKVVPSFASTDAENKERCHVYLLNLYMEKVPKEALSKDAFYVCPVAKVSDAAGSLWFTSVPVGKTCCRRCCRQCAKTLDLHAEQIIVCMLQVLPICFIRIFSKK